MRRPEQAIHKAVALHLQMRGAPGMFWWHTPNGGARSKVEAMIFKGLGVRAGIPDILALHQGQLYALELKADKRKPSAVQVACHARLRAAGASCDVAASLDAAIAKLESWGLLRGRAA